VVLPVISRRTAEITMTRRRRYIMVALISHFRKKIMKRKVRMTMTLSAANARIDHFLNEEGGPSISPVTGSALDRRTKKNL
jgi:hypothetical protein